jgi:Uma2 family endonuclease
MVQYLPSAEELPDSDDTPVDNELQILVPALLRAILAQVWIERWDWFLGVNMGVYYEPKESAIVPDGFLSLGVQRFKGSKLRLSYVLWQEDNIVPQLALEVVSRTPGDEYGDKMAKYAQIGVLYYVIYNPDYYRRDKHDPFEVYRLVNGVYIRQSGQLVWMPEIGLGIGCEQGNHEGYNREWLYWYNQQGERLPAPGNVIAQERQRAEQAEQQLAQERRLREELLNRLRARGIDVDEV